MKSRHGAAALSLLVPGLGQAYLGLVRRGIVWAAVGPLFVVVLALALPEAPPGAMLAAFAGVVVVPRALGIIDALMTPNERQRPVKTGLVIAVAVLLLVIAQAGTGALRRFVIEAFKVPSGSMLPTVLVGEHFFVDKAVFRKRDPHRGELAIFKSPEHPEQSFLKRVIGLPGDRIDVRGGMLFLNDEEIPTCTVGPWSYAEPDGGEHTGTLYVEFLGDAAAYLVFLDHASLANDHQGPFTVGADQFFVLGDNRNNAYDSRMWFGGAGGGVPREHLKGAPRVVWSSPDSTRVLFDLASAPRSPSPALDAEISRCLASRPPPSR